MATGLLKALLILWLCVLILPLDYAPLRAETIQPSLRYHLKVTQDSANNGLAYVTMTYASSYSSNTFAMYRNSGGWYDPIEVRGFNATDSNGAILPVRYTVDTLMKQTWSISMDHAGNITAHYAVNLRYFDKNTGNGGAFMGYLGPSFLLTWAGWIFLLPQGYTGLVGISFDVPSGWIVGVPWAQQGDEHSSRAGDLFASSTVATGTFVRQTTSIAGSQVTVLVHSQFPTSDISQTLSFAKDTMPYVSKLFDAPPPANYLAVFVPKVGRQRIDFIEAYNSAGDAVDGFGMNLMYSFLHRLFHTFNAFSPTGMNMRYDTVWFSEGCNVYFDSKIPYLFRYTADLNWMGDYLQEYNSQYGTTYDGPVSNYNAPPVAFSDRGLYLHYGKAALVWFLIDSLLLRTSGGTSGVDSLLRAMYVKFGNYHGVLSNDDLQTALTIAASNVNFNKFLQLYVYGTAALPIKHNTVPGIEVDWEKMVSDIGNIPGQPIQITPIIQQTQTTASMTPTTSQQEPPTTSTQTAGSTVRSQVQSVGGAFTVEFPLSVAAVIAIAVAIVLATRRRKKTTS